MGLTQLNLTGLDDSKSIGDSEINPISSVNNNEETNQSVSKEIKTNEKNHEISKKFEKEPIINTSSLSNDVLNLFF